MDHNMAVHLFRLASNEGLAEAQYILGDLHDRGYSVVDPDPAEAARLFRLAAQQGLADAQYALGVALEAGDNAEAARWFSHAAAQGDAAAVRALNRIRAAAQSR
jgi:hypothetical protein